MTMKKIYKLLSITEKEKKYCGMVWNSGVETINEFSSKLADKEDMIKAIKMIFSQERPRPYKKMWGICPETSKSMSY
jgi:hypothetical protein